MAYNSPQAKQAEYLVSYKNELLDDDEAFRVSNLVTPRWLTVCVVVDLVQSSPDTEHWLNSAPYRTLIR